MSWGFFVFFHYYFYTFIIIIIIFSLSLIRVFHISVSWWFFIGFWVTASLLKLPGHFSVYSGRSQQCYRLDGSHLSSYFQVLQFLCQLSVPNAPITIGITVNFLFHIIFSFSVLSQSLGLSFAFFQFYPVDSRNGKILYSAGSF